MSKLQSLTINTKLNSDSKSTTKKSFSIQWYKNDILIDIHTLIVSYSYTNILSKDFPTGIGFMILTMNNFRTTCLCPKSRNNLVITQVIQNI